MGQLFGDLLNESPGPEGEPLTFERAMERLEEIVRLLEGGELPLDETVRLYEEGMRLIAFCRRKLDEAEKRVKMLVINEETGELELRDFEGE